MTRSRGVTLEGVAKAAPSLFNKMKLVRMSATFLVFDDVSGETWLIAGHEYQVNDENFDFLVSNGLAEYISEEVLDVKPSLEISDGPRKSGRKRTGGERLPSSGRKRRGRKD